MWQTPVRCHLTAWLNPLIVHLFFWCWEWRWEVPLVYPDFVVTLNYPTGSIPMGVEITWEENAPNKTNLKDLLGVKWMSEALSLLSAIRILQEGWAAPLCHIHQCYNSLLVPERFLHSQGKGGLHNSFYIKQLALAFPSFGCLKWSHLYLSGLSVEHWWGLCLLPKWITVGFWVFTVVLFQFFKSLLVLPTFVGSLNEWGNSFSFWANDWELNSVLQNSTCKLESLTLKKNPRNNKTGPKTQAQNSEWKYILIFIINAGSALCVLYFTFTQPDL